MPHDCRRSATGDPQTAINWTYEIVGQVARTIVKTVLTVVCLWGLLCDPEEVTQTIFDPVYAWVGHTVGALPDIQQFGGEFFTNDITLNADITITGGGSPTLVIGPDGQIDAARTTGVTAAVASDRIVVDPII